MRACADDINSVHSSEWFLQEIAELFKMFETLSWLVLKPAKCKLAPLAPPFTLILKTSVQEFLVVWALLWARFDVASRLTLLGLSMGRHPAAMT